MADEAENPKVDIAEASEIGTACHKMLETCLRAGLQPPLNRYKWSDAIEVVTRDDGSAHATLSPSAAERWTVCPGSVVLVGKAVEATPRVTQVKVTDDMIEWVEVALRWVLGYLRENPECVLYSEERARAGIPFECPDEMWGTADVVIVNRRKLELVIADAKFGYNEVRARRNPQLLLYTIGLAHDFGWAFENYRNVILQPRSELPVKEDKLSQPELWEEFERLRPKVARAIEQLQVGHLSLELVPSDDGCKWCEAAGICPKLQERAIQLARREFAEPELLSREDLVMLLRESDRIEAGLKAAKAHATRLLQLGQKVPGYKLVRGRKRRVWVNEVEAGRALIKLGVPSAEVFKSELQFTPPQAEKKVGKAFADLLEPLIETPLGEPCLAPEEDPRLPLPPEFEPC